MLADVYVLPKKSLGINGSKMLYQAQVIMEENQEKPQNDLEKKDNTETLRSL